MREEIRTGEQHPIERIMSTAMTRIKSMVQADTVVGEPLTTPDGTTVIPVSKVTVGLVAGGGEYGDNSVQKNKHVDDFPFAGGSGAGMTVQPIGFLVNDGKGIRMVKLDNETAYDKLIDMVPGFVGSLLRDDKKQ